jgi:hypothetical protein
MKKSLIFGAFILILLISFVSASDIIMKLSSESNSHAENSTQSNYGISILYSDIFGLTYDLSTPNGCSGDNIVLKLSSDTNAHAQDSDLTTYTSNVCYGDLFCRYTTGACSLPEMCVVTLSSNTNAHLAKCDSLNAYTNKICCSSLYASSGGPVDLCNESTEQNECINLGDLGCTWSPRGKLSPEAGCCPANQQWNPAAGVCGGSANLCTDVFFKGDYMNDLTLRDNNYGPALDPFENKYCAQVTGDLSYGFWYPTESY